MKSCGFFQTPQDIMEKYKGCSVLQYTAYGSVNIKREGVAWVLDDVGQKLFSKCWQSSKWLHIIDTPSYRVKDSKDREQKWEQDQWR